MTPVRIQKLMVPHISVVIATKNRERKLTECLHSIMLCNFSNYEIIIVDQSDMTLTSKTIDWIQNKQIKYIKQPGKGKANALNKGLLFAVGDVIAFTDDDCIVDKNWLKTLHDSFADTAISGAFGRTLSYNPHANQNMICPCTFDKPTKSYIQKPIYHATHIGFGNNMAIRKSALKTLGGFKEWLGPGSIGSNAEDAEIALRLLTKEKKILYNPRMIVYHNKWLAQDEVKKQSLSYICGEMACYGYFHFQGYQFATPIILNNIYDSYHQIKNIIKHVPNLSWNRQFFSDMYNTLKEIVYRIRGLVIGWFFAHIYPIR